MMQMSQHYFLNHGNFFEDTWLRITLRWNLRKFGELPNKASNEKFFVQGLRKDVLTTSIQFYVRTTFTEILKTLLYQLLFLSSSTLQDTTFSVIISVSLFFFFFFLPFIFFFGCFPDREPRVCGLYPRFAEPNRFRRYFALKL